MRVAVVSPIYKPNPDWLAQCLASVRAQTHPCTHILVIDGSDDVPPADFSGQVIRLSHNHGDWGDTPRTLGSLSAIAQGFDAIAYLDQDCWYYPEHIASLVQVHQQTGAPFCTSSRDIYHIDGSLLGKCKETDGRRFVDANCFFLTRKAFRLVTIWSTMPAAWHVCSDIFFFAQVRRLKVPTAHLDRNTMGYRATRSHTYRLYGVEPPPGVKSSEEIVRTLREKGAIGPARRQAP